ncbi:MAG: hypothetical protein EBQ80_01160 [Proteobacteria bacterium]|nr:hypothetical protein [Pseudomonadota bacterium]
MGMVGTGISGVGIAGAGIAAAATGCGAGWGVGRGSMVGSATAGVVGVLMKESSSTRAGLGGWFAAGWLALGSVLKALAAAAAKVLAGGTSGDSGTEMLGGVRGVVVAATGLVALKFSGAAAGGETGATVAPVGGNAPVRRDGRTRLRAMVVQV